MILHVSLRSSSGVPGTFSKSAAVHLHLHKILLFNALALLQVVDVVVVVVVTAVLLVSVIEEPIVIAVSFDGDSMGLDRVLV